MVRGHEGRREKAGGGERRRAEAGEGGRRREQGKGKAFCSGQDLSDGGNAATLDLERVLRDAPFNNTVGWDSVGRPSAVVPEDDHVWWRRRGNSRIVDSELRQRQQRDQCGRGPALYASHSDSVIASAWGRSVSGAPTPPRSAILASLAATAARATRCTYAHTACAIAVTHSGATLRRPSSCAASRIRTFSARESTAIFS